MIKAKNNLITEIDADHYAIYNPLSGAFDIASKEELDRFVSGIPCDEHERQLWLERGYCFDSDEEAREYTSQRYNDFLVENRKNTVQFLLIPSYGCNFNCSYCYQKGVEASTPLISIGMIDSFIDFVIKYREKEHKEVVVTLFGGEPLLPGENNRNMLSHLITALARESIRLSVVTNGYYLSEYMNILSHADILEVHVSLDGDEDFHNERRRTKDGKDSFSKIMQGIDAAVQQGFPINIRMIVDKLNISSLPGLAAKFAQRGYLGLPKEKFKSTLGRNYELINEYRNAKDLFGLTEMFEEYVKLMIEYPLLEKLYVPEFFGITAMMNNKEMYIPNFDTCPAAKSEYVFDCAGTIYGCTASCGQKGYELGTYYPVVAWNEPELNLWRSRSVLTIEKCRDCVVDVVCGGGCGVLAKEKNGSINAPLCKPVKEVMDIGIRYYKDELLRSGAQCCVAGT
ncbi:MAG: hypothetical protein DKM50_00475 [Candidatus Margulisiibacteriota bacterium]|nr:MAG: hypothetical protein A2X43_06405 [Candidatus Margulisbacteria bacterium GWD2_39_127]OGI05581.1 MAG: hypothetical protein A2X42_08785 [Candidatus Margulisbacteria bacterium GWF2_38_17]OGI07538.1 MAG: hypothetical protein A2X41_08690 [Candidatus Margulisbacteria bacterium GWE2_39_32]PZM84893.1 MAG: hypothetical protein DKM50_00475 [Candidatus Margulisiibacteriota bacterium]HAR64021.1 hypothetical protein [Candidatus Margulisiibacteriota bacterium]